MRNLLYLVLSLTLIQCSTNKTIKSKTKTTENQDFRLDTLTLFDKERNRNIPVAIYQPKNPKKANRIPVFFSHGYGENNGKDYLQDYTYLTEFLVSNGYFVVSIQHELKMDEPLAMTGNLQETRRPNWEKGVQNILFVKQEIEKKYSDLNFNKLSLIGHSNGGDMTVLFAHKFPTLVSKIISMDNRRMKLPRTSNPKIFTLRSNDYPADESVLPTAEEMAQYGITVQFTNISHSSMDNDANKRERKYLTTKILEYLEK